MLQVGQQSHVGIWERGLFRLQALNNLRRVLAPDNIQPFLYVGSVLELRALSCAHSCKELIEVELVELSGARDRQQFVRHLISKQTHLWQRTIRVPLAAVLGGEIFLGALFVRVGPVEDLFFDELACGQRLKRCAGKIEICLGRDGEEFYFLLREHGKVFVHVL